MTQPDNQNEPAPLEASAKQLSFTPDYTPEQLEHLGVYDSLYRGQGPRLASLGAWKPEWVSEHDPKGWAQWYKRYAAGRRLEGEDERQIKRWLSLKARHGGPFAKNPTPRRGWALRNWAIDPATLVPEAQRQGITEMLDEYKNTAMQKHLAKQADLLPGISLQPHQQRVADKVTGDENRMLVYHGLGSGKSLSALAAAEAAKRQFGDNYGVVVPAALKGNFNKEIKKFTDSDPEVLSYTALGMGKEFQEPPQTLIMDEAHRLRNPDGAAANAASAQARSARNLLLLTGSPITNAPSDLANLLSLLHNGKMSPEQFNARYIGHKTVNPGVLNWFRGIKPGEEPVVQNEGELRSLLRGHVDYQPSKNPKGVNVSEETIHVPLSPAQQKIQKAVRTKIPPGFLWKLDQEFPLSRDELAKLNSFMTGLRQVSMSTRPFRADHDPLKSFEQSSKLQLALKNLQGTLASDPRKKAIIYSNHIDAGLAPYAAALEKHKIPHALFHGSISPTERQKAVDEYNAGKLRALLIGPAGAEGLSTKGTSLIQLLDPHWHESRSQQARGRGLRFDSHEGLPEDLKNVNVQRYLSSSEDPSWVGKLMGYTRERTGDEVLAHLAASKEMLNDKFRKILQEEGTQKASAELALTGAREWYKAAAPRRGGMLGSALSVLGHGLQTAAKTAPKLAKPALQTAKTVTTPVTTHLANRAPQAYRPAAQLAARGAQYGVTGTALYGGYTGTQHAVGQAARGAAQNMTADPAALDQIEQRAKANMLPLAYSMLAPKALGGDDTEIGQALRNHAGTAIRHFGLPTALSSTPAYRAPSRLAIGAALGNPALTAVRAFLPARPSAAQMMQSVPAEETQKMTTDMTRAMVAPNTASSINNRMQHIFEPAVPTLPNLQSFLPGRVKGSAELALTGAREWYKQALAPRPSPSILPFPGMQAQKKKRRRKPLLPRVSDNALAGGVAAGAAALPLISLHQDAFGTYPTLREKVRSAENLYFPQELVDSGRVQHGDVGTFFGEPQPWFKEKKPNFGKLTHGGEWTSGTGTYHGMLLRPHNGGVQILEGGDSFPERDALPVTNGEYQSPFHAYVKKRDAADLAAGRIGKSDVGLYNVAEGNPKFNPLLHDFEHNTSQNSFNRYTGAFNKAVAPDQQGDAKNMSFPQRFGYYLKHITRQGKLLEDFKKKEMTPEMASTVWDPLTDRDHDPFLVQRSPQVDSLLKSPATAAATRANIDQAYTDYAYRPYNLGGAVNAGARRLFFPKISPTEIPLQANPKSVPLPLKPICTEDYCVQPASRVLGNLGVPIGANPASTLPADLAANPGMNTVGLVIPTPGTRDKVRYGLSGTKSVMQPGAPRWYQLANAARNQKLMEADAPKLEQYKQDQRSDIINKWMPQSRNRRIMTGLLAAGILGAAGYGGTKLVQSLIRRRREALAAAKEKEEVAARRKLLAAERRQARKGQQTSAAVSKAAAAAYFRSAGLQ